MVDSLHALFYVGTLTQIEFEARFWFSLDFGLELRWRHFDLNVEVFVSFSYYHSCYWIQFALLYQLSTQIFDLLVEVSGRFVL